eukprot:3238996-Heterocapsa_arctica.AAC.1
MGIPAASIQNLRRDHCQKIPGSHIRARFAEFLAGPRPFPHRQRHWGMDQKARAKTGNCQPDSAGLETGGGMPSP